jgi:hypothetical protein
MNQKNKPMAYVSCGELGWDLYLSAHIKYVNRHMGRNIPVMTYPDRFCLYPETISLPEEYYEEFKDTQAECFGRRNIHPQKLKDFFSKYIDIPDYFQFTCNPLFQTFEMVEYTPYMVKNHYSLKRIIVFPRRRDGDFAVRNLPKEFYEELIYTLCQKFRGVQIFTVGTLEESYNINLAIGNYTNFISKTDIQGVIDIVTGSIATIGSQSSLPKLSLLQKTPSYLVGHERYRHTIKENWLSTKVGFWEIKLEEYNSFNNLECVFKIIEFIKGSQNGNKNR